MMPPVSPRARARALLLMLLLAVLASLGAAAAPAGAEGPGYDGAGGSLRVRVLDAADEGPSTTAEPAGVATVEVRGDGFLANSAVTIRTPGGRAVRASADQVGTVVARVRLSGQVGGRVWITATGTDPSFQRRVVTDHVSLSSAGSPVSATTLLLGAAAAAIAVSVVIGVRRRGGDTPTADRSLGGAS